jgi:hypothetical protein
MYSRRSSDVPAPYLNSTALQSRDLGDRVQDYQCYEGTQDGLRFAADSRGYADRRRQPDAGRLPLLLPLEPEDAVKDRG